MEKAPAAEGVPKEAAVKASAIVLNSIQNENLNKNNVIGLI